MVIGCAIKYLLFTCAASTALAIVLPEESRLIRIPMTKQYDSLKGLQRKRSTKLYSDYGYRYLVDIAVGIPPQVFELAVDTGSSDLWIPGSQCPDSLCPLVKFNEANSTTYKATSENFNIKYGTGNATGKYALDTITIAGATIEEQQFGYVSATNNILTEVTSLSGDEVATTNETIASDSYYHMNEVYGDSGEIIFGGIDKTKYTGEIIYVPVSKTTRQTSSIQTKTDYGYWQVNGQGVGVANGVTADVKLDFQETVNLIFDTGATLVVYQLMCDNFPLAYCSVAKQNTTIQIMMSQSTDSTTEPVTMHIPHSDVLIPLETSATICAFGIVPVESRYVIGESLLRSLYQVYDAEKK
ncbi:hypothetical protein INT47_000204 [Mucor saturninus]|uniref:rhizopuspepsin n=1 Tax=Mucor saturninus TaxID=64648 RepID=A0A8H7R2H9_9FUNG|nr:hypothetical protein INT47_000204 [Mucor saturninus]